MTVAVVTGAGSGIGRATAVALARRGLDLALVGRTESPLRETATALTAVTGRVPRAIVVVADVSVEGAVETAAATVLRELGTPRVVVNNAGIAGRKARIEDTTAAEWDAVMGGNLRGVFLVTRAFLPAMRAAGTGRIVTIGSISSTLGTAGLSPY
ncbi:MAG TPA: SDR family NAD(P)-dependent oxidoreductase, partial [Polyangiaceae bacterium]